MRVPAERILIVLLGAIGDVTRALPLLNRLRAGYPRAHLAWALEPTAAPVLEHHPALDARLIFERRGGARAFAAFLARVRAERFDLVLDLQRHAKSGLVSAASRAPVRIGFHRRNAKELNWLWNTHTIAPVEGRGWKLAQYLRFADLLELPAQAPRFDVRLTRRGGGERGASARAGRASVRGHLSRLDLGEPMLVSRSLCGRGRRARRARPRCGPGRWPRRAAISPLPPSETARTRRSTSPPGRRCGRPTVSSRARAWRSVRTRDRCTSPPPPARPSCRSGARRRPRVRRRSARSISWWSAGCRAYRAISGGVRSADSACKTSRPHASSPR